MSKNKTFTPAWCELEAPPQSYRSLFKWGDPKGFKHPGRGLYALLKEKFSLTDTDFLKPELGMEIVDQVIPSKLAERHTRAFIKIVGEENAHGDTYHRIRASYGGGAIDALRLRHKIIENIPDLVLCPRDETDIAAIVSYCDDKRIPLYIYGGGSSVTRGMEAVKGGVTLDLSVHLNKVININEIDQTVTVQAGIYGPELERILNRAPETLKASRGYTVGHFPQSFEHSSVGGWVVTRGAGQNSTYYGKIEDMVISQEYITPRGEFKTGPHPRCATGPDFDQIMIGCEGTFGVLTRVTLRLCRYMPENTQRFGFLFKTWEDALAACREMMQSEQGLPSVFRLSDPEETDVGLRTYHIHGTPADKVLQTLGYQPMQRCLLIGASDGSLAYARMVAKHVRRVAGKYHAFSLTLFKVTQAWEKSRFTDPFMREDLTDFGVVIDTLECAVTWAQMPEVHRSVRAVVKARPQTVCMTHLSHVYPQGGNLYFIFIGRMKTINEYLDLQYAILEAIQKSGAAMSHHHGVGKQTAPWLEGQIGKPAMELLHSLREHFDPHGIMNPGGTLGLDMTPEQKTKKWGYRKTHS
jgi:alkyldihydroxyacetonephosphate synthase